MFSKKLVREDSGTRRGASGATFSVLGADMAITGNISASADLHIDGRVEGDVICAALMQGEGSEIVGAIRAESVRLAGTVRGSITTRELVILKSAHINGDIHYDALTIEQGATVDGRLSPRGAAAISESGESRLILASSTS